MEAYQIAYIFEQVTGDDLPVNLDEWKRIVRTPTELYFVFKRRRDLGRFLRQISLECPHTEVIE